MVPPHGAARGAAGLMRQPRRGDEAPQLSARAGAGGVCGQQRHDRSQLHHRGPLCMSQQLQVGGRNAQVQATVFSFSLKLDKRREACIGAICSSFSAREAGLVPALVWWRHLLLDSLRSGSCPQDGGLTMSAIVTSAPQVGQRRDGSAVRAGRHHPESHPGALPATGHYACRETVGVLGSAVGKHSFMIIFARAGGSLATTCCGHVLCSMLSARLTRFGASATVASCCSLRLPRPPYTGRASTMMGAFTLTPTGTRSLNLTLTSTLTQTQTRPQPQS